MSSAKAREADISMMTYPSLANEKLVDVVRLIRTNNVGPVTFFQLMRRFGSASKALAALPELSSRGGRKQTLMPYTEEQALKEIEAAQSFGAYMIMYGTPEYPKLLHHIPDAPPVITVSGSTQVWQEKESIAMVGARNASANGCQLAHKLARELGEHGLLVTSGLARGIDSFAHKGALATGTVGVIAGGIDNIYPPENAPLYQQIRESGAIISEQSFGSLPYSGSFPGRNRIIAGMSMGTLVVEASPKSGSLITARFALENNREVFAIPGSPLDPRSKGCNQLIKQGAILVESVEDIVHGIAHLRSRRMEESLTPAFHHEPSFSQQDDNELQEARRLIIQKLGITPVGIDVLIEQSQIPAQTVAIVLLELELAGRLRRAAGNKVALTEVEEPASAA
jgi:DNA processing protein